MCVLISVCPADLENRVLGIFLNLVFFTYLAVGNDEKITCKVIF